MIQCPICHVLNEDRSLFCAECGQRFAPQAPAPQAPAPQVNAPSPPPENINATPPPEAPPKRPAIKLHSPILGGGSVEPEEPAPGRNRFASSRFGGGSTGSNPVAGPSPNARNRGPARQDFGDDEDEDTNPKSKPRKGLHSPLLDFGDDEPEQQSDGHYKAQSKSQIMFPHRSRGASTGSNAQVPPEPDADPTPRPQGKGGLRSPLLGGDDSDQYDEGDDDFSNPNQPRKKLRSPVLDGNPRSNNRFVPDPPVEIREESNVLRSPLLARKVPLPEKQAPGAAVPPPEPPAKINQPPGQQSGWPQAPQRPDSGVWSNTPVQNEMQAPPQAPNVPQTPQFVPPAVPSFDQSAPPNQPAYGQPSFNQPNAPTQQSFDQPTFNQPVSLNSAPFNQVSPAAQVIGNVPPADFMARESAWDPPAAAAPAVIPPTAPTAEPDPFPTVKPSTSPLSSLASSSSSLRSRSSSATESGAKAESESFAEPPILRSKRSSTRLPSAINSEPQPDMFPSKKKHIGFAKFMLFPFFAAAAFKIWYLVAMGPQALSSAPFLGDQVSQLVVIICLIIFTFIATSES